MTDNPYIPCPSCRTRGTLQPRTRYERVPVDELSDRYPNLAARFDALGELVGRTEPVKVAIPELACEACGHVFDAAAPAPKRGGRS